MCDFDLTFQAGVLVFQLSHGFKVLGKYVSMYDKYLQRSVKTAGDFSTKSRI